MTFVNRDSDNRGGDEDSGLRLGVGAISSLSGIGVLLVFMAQNTEDVTVSFLFWDITWPVWLMTLLTAAFGALVWFGLGVLRRRSRRKERRQNRRD